MWYKQWQEYYAMYQARMASIVALLQANPGKVAVIQTAGLYMILWQKQIIAGKIHPDGGYVFNPWGLAIQSLLEPNMQPDSWVDDGYMAQYDTWIDDPQFAEFKALDQQMVTKTYGVNFT